MRVNFGLISGLWAGVGGPAVAEPPPLLLAPPQALTSSATKINDAQSVNRPRWRNDAALGYSLMFITNLHCWSLWLRDATIHITLVRGYELMEHFYTLAHGSNGPHQH